MVGGRVVSPATPAVNTNSRPYVYIRGPRGGPPNMGPAPPRPININADLKKIQRFKRILKWNAVIKTVGFLWRGRDLTTRPPPTQIGS